MARFHEYERQHKLHHTECDKYASKKWGFLSRHSGCCSTRNDLADDMAVHIRETTFEPIVIERQPFMVESDQV